MKSQHLFIAFAFAVFCAASAFGYQTGYQQSRDGVQPAFTQETEVVLMNSELLFNDGVLQSSRVLNGLLKSDVEQKGSKISPKKKAAKFYKEASDLYDREKYDEALDIIDKALKYDSNNRAYKRLKQKIEDELDELELKNEADGLAADAKNLLADGEFDDALKKISKALKMFPGDRDYKRIKQKIEDAKENDEARQRQEDAKGLISDADELSAQGRFDEALKKVEEAKALDPENSFRYNSKRRDIENARLDYKEKQQQKEIQDLIVQAKELFEKKMYVEALDRIDEAIKLDPSNVTFKQLRQEVELAKDPFWPINRKAGDRAVKEINGVEFAFRWCPPGTFMMGSPISEIDIDFYKDAEGSFRVDETQHQVTLTKGFWMLETEVTVGMFRAFVNETRYESRGDVPYRTLIYPRVARSEPDFSWQNAGYSQTDSHPVTIVSWDDAVAFCSWLSQKIGLGVQLPTEAQWEYACRAGSSSAYSWGNVLNGDKANCDGTRPYRTEQSGPFLKEKAPVRSYAPNLWGLYDMHGNVWEWCQDWLGKYPDRSVTDPEGSSTGETRAIRGGSFIDWACESRSASRENWKPGFRTNYLGFRCLAMPQSDDE